MRTTRTVVSLAVTLCVATMMFTGAAAAQSLIDIEGDEPDIELTDSGGSGSGGVTVSTDQATVGGGGLVEGDTEDGVSIDLDGEGSQGDREGSADVELDASPDGEASAIVNSELVTEQVSVGEGFRDDVRLEGSLEEGVSGRINPSAQVADQVQAGAGLDQFSAHPEEGANVLAGGLVFSEPTGTVGALLACNITPESASAPQEACQGTPVDPSDPQGSLENLQDRLEEQLPLPADQLN